MLEAISLRLNPVQYFTEKINNTFLITLEQVFPEQGEKKLEQLRGKLLAPKIKIQKLVHNGDAWACM